MKDDLKGSVRAVMCSGSETCFDYDLSLFNKPSDKYDHELSRLSCRFVTVGYDGIIDDPEAENESGFPYTQPGVRDMLNCMGFTSREIQSKSLRDEEAYFFAHRELKLGNESFDLYVAAFIGSYKKTWYSNFDPLGVDRICRGGMGYAGDDEKGAIHLGFADARDYSLERLESFIKRTRESLPVKLLLTGHSRGAATAGLMAAKILANGGIGSDIPVKADDLYTYCFATPNYADGKLTNIYDRRFARIFNVVSPEDFVTEVFPKASGFGKYGTVYSIFGSDNASRGHYAREKAVMTRFFRDYRGSQPYASYKKGSRDVEKVIAVMAESMKDLDTYYNKKMRLCFKSCTPFEYFKITLCAFVGGVDSPEDQANRDRAAKLLSLSSLDTLGTSPALRKISAFFLFKQGVAQVTGRKIGNEYFNDAHIAATYLAYLMSMTEKQLKKIK